MFNNSEFYPTPINIIRKMLEGIDFKFIESVLEPSAGKGDLADEVINKLKHSRSYYHNKDHNFDIDTIEIDQNLQHILKGKKYRITHDDFLTYKSYKKYDLIIMNPPFSNGEKHLLKALEMQKEGGQIVCLLNAETLKNTYSNTRKDLETKLEQYNAQIEYIQDAFIDAERSTDVEIALIKIDIPKIEHNSSILSELRQEEQFREDTKDNNSNNLIEADFVNGIIQQYSFEIKAGLKLISEYEALKPFMLTALNDKCDNTVLKLNLNYADNDSNCNMKNSYIKQIRMKYWKALFTSDKFMGLFTSNLRNEYYNKVSELRNYDFSLYNIQTIKIELSKQMIKGVGDTILSLFDEFSNKHHWYDEMSKNIHMYNGWKTNKAWKINNKVIIPLSGFSSWSNRIDYDYNVLSKLTDVEKVFNYLDNNLTEEVNLEEVLKLAENYGETKKIETKYFLLTFYKKGTCHIEFRNLELLHKFNLYGSQQKGWLPPSYGKAKYKDMTQEEKETINDFEGEISYNKVMNNKDYYIVNTSNLLMLAQ